jgi:hypothetical protein
MFLERSFLATFFFVMNIFVVLLEKYSIIELKRSIHILGGIFYERRKNVYIKNGSRRKNYS